MRISLGGATSFVESASSGKVSAMGTKCSEEAKSTPGAKTDLVASERGVRRREAGWAACSFPADFCTFRKFY